MSKQNGSIIGIILAAGMGKRLSDLTDNQPKALVRVVNIALIDYSVAFLNALGVDNIIIIGGYLFNELSTHVCKYHQNIVVLENKEYEKQNALSALIALKNIKIDNSIIMTDVDFIRTHTMANKLDLNNNLITLFISDQDKLMDPDNLRVRYNDAKQILNMAKGLTEYDGISAGLLFFPEGKRNILIASMETAILKHGTSNARLEDGLMQCIDAGHSLKASNVGIVDWFEIDTLEDLIIAESFMKNNKKDIVVPEYLTDL